MRPRGTPRHQEAVPARPSARIYFHPNASTPQARLSMEARLRLFAADLDRLDRDFASGANPYVVAGELLEATNRVTPEDGRDTIETLRHMADRHPIQRHVQQCPLTRLARQMRAGQLGHPRLLDGLERHDTMRPALDSASLIGRGIALHLLDNPFSAGTRARRCLIASQIAATAHAVPGARILALGCGHARELELLPAEERATLGAFTGVDTEPENLRIVARHAIGTGTASVVRATPRAFMAEQDMTGFDLIYAGSLCAYLPDRQCRQLTRDLFRRLNPGGRLLLGGPLPGHPGYGYMEIFMHWSVVHRDRDRMADFARGIAAADLARMGVIVEPNRCIGLLELTRA